MCPHVECENFKKKNFRVVTCGVRSFQKVTLAGVHRDHPIEVTARRRFGVGTNKVMSGCCTIRYRVLEITSRRTPALDFLSAQKYKPTLSGAWRRFLILRTAPADFLSAFSKAPFPIVRTRPLSHNKLRLGVAQSLVEKS